MKTIPLTRNYFTKVDNEDYKKFASFRWYAAFDKREKKNRACRKVKINGKWSTEHLARVIMKAPKGIYIDHINQNTLDNRRCNLRFCNESTNQMNMKRRKDNISGYKGVSWFKSSKAWYTSITKNGTRYYFGPYRSKIKAALKYDELAKELFKEFAKLNFPKRKSSD